MPKCKNDSTRKYEGTEPSPKGKGYCAHAIKVGITMKGRDGNQWIVKKIKNGSKRWIKYKGKIIKSKWIPFPVLKQSKKDEKSKKISLEKWYNLKVIHPKNIKKYMKNKILSKLLKIKSNIYNLEINYFIVPLVLDNTGKYWTNYPDSYMNNFYDKTYKDTNYIRIIIYINNNLTIDTSRDVIIQYKMPLSKRKQLVYIFKKQFSKNFIYSGKKKDVMLLRYK